MDLPLDSDLSGTDLSTRVTSKLTSEPAGKQSELDMDSKASDLPELSIFVEEGELSNHDQDLTATDPDQTLSEEQTYGETMRGIWLFMGWSHIPEIDTAAANSDDNPFAGPKLQLAGKLLVFMPTDEWLCKKLSKVSVTLVEGNLSHCSEVGGHLKDQFIRPAKSQSW